MSKLAPKSDRQDMNRRALEVCTRMDRLYHDASSALHFHSPFECVIAVLLSAQTSDRSVNRVTPGLFKRWPDAQTMSQAKPKQLERCISSIGLYHNKAKYCVGTARMIVDEFGDQVPDSIDELLRLPGVGRKTALIVLNSCYGLCCGIAVDTHVFRVAHRLGFSSAKNAAETEKDLCALIPQAMWPKVNSQWILFGRQYCGARLARCADCPLSDLCPMNCR